MIENIQNAFYILTLTFNQHKFKKSIHTEAQPKSFLLFSWLLQRKRKQLYSSVPTLSIYITSAFPPAHSLVWFPWANQARNA